MNFVGWVLWLSTMHGTNKLKFMSVCLSIRMEQISSNWRDFNEILHLSIFRNSVEGVQVSLKSDINNRYTT